MFFLEQEILKKKLAEKASNVEESPFGLDVYFNKQEHAVKFAEACQTLVPIGNRTESKQLTGQDSQNNQFKFRHTICLEIVPICKHDLCVMSKPLRSSLLGGSRNGIIVVESVARNVHVRDIETGKTAELQASKFFAHPFRTVAVSKALVEFMVLDVEESDESGSYVVEVARMKDFGENDQRFFVRTWSKFASNKLESGDTVLGYDLTAFQDDDVTDPASVPSAVLIKKNQEENKERRRQKRREQRNGRGETRSYADESVGGLDDAQQEEEDIDA
jgi:nonsense-mediated mRNA decay protein 3